MTKLIAILIIASACLFAQAAKAPAAEERWEYCIAQTIPGGQTFNGNVEGYAAVFYATEQGRREETITLSEPMPEGMSQSNVETAFWRAGERALGKALALLGKNGWELVSVQQLPPSGNYVQRTLFFKRLVR